MQNKPSAVLRPRAYPVSLTLKLCLERLLEVLGVNTRFGPLKLSLWWPAVSESR